MKMLQYAALTDFAATSASPVVAAAKAADALMYKDPDCECRLGHAVALRRAGIALKVVPIADMAALKATAGVPTALRSCHTLIVGRYAVEGHVPIAVIKRSIAERPAVRGIALPGMPIGSPGMKGPKTEPFRMMSFGTGAQSSMPLNNCCLVRGSKHSGSASTT